MLTTLQPSVKIYVALGAADLRRSVDGLSLLVRESLRLEPFSGHLFLFRNQRADRLKILVWDRSGFWVLHKFDRNRWGRYSQDDPLLRSDDGNPELSLAHHRSRYYDPTVGRFSSDDPISLGSRVGLYSYSSGNPLRYIDPLGLRDNPPGTIAKLNAMKKANDCATKAFEEEFNAAIARGNQTGRGGWRFAHCMTACRARKCGISTPEIAVAGLWSEVKQSGECLFKERGWHGPACETALARADFKDNHHGYTCPANESCEQRCRGRARSDKEPHDFGPFWGSGQ